MAANQNLVENDDEDIEPQQRYSSSDVVVAAEELKFKTGEKKKVIKSQLESGKISKKEAGKQLEEAYKTMAHTYTLDELAQHYETSLDKGLTVDQAKDNLVKYGYNELTPPKQDPWWLRLLKSIFGGFFNVLLWFGSILCFIAYAISPAETRDVSYVEYMHSLHILDSLFLYILKI